MQYSIQNQLQLHQYGLGGQFPFQNFHQMVIFSPLIPFI